MRSVSFALSCAAVLVAASIDGPSLRAQSDERTLSQLEIAVACAPPTSLDPPAGHALHVAGAQDTGRRSLFGATDQLVIDGGTSADVQLNQQYFIRRPIGSGYGRGAQGIATVGWVRIVAVNDATAIAAVQHMCDGITTGDYLEPFVAPSVPADLVRAEPTGELDFTALGRVVTGVENRALGGVHSLILIDRGSDQGTTAGARFAVFRDLREKSVPLAAVGEGVVVSVGKSLSLAWLTRSRDAVVPGDFVVPRK
jgi:hypothetical protein